MSIRLSAAITLTGIAPLDLIEKLSPVERNKAASISVTNLVQRHLTDYDRSHPNQLGGKRTHHYRRLAQSTNWNADEVQGVVNISDFRAAQTILGGKITPGKNPSYTSGKPTRALTIPATAEAHGERAKKFDGKSVAFYFKTPHGKLLGMIVDKQAARRKVSSGTNIARGSASLSEKGVFKFKRVLFWLVSEVDQKPNPGAIPSDDQIVDGAILGVRKLVRDVFRDSPKATAVVWRAK